MQGIFAPWNAPRLLLALALTLLAACSTSPTRQNPAAEVGAVSQLEQAGKYADAATLGEKLAAAAQASQRNEFLVSAAEDWQLAGNSARSWAAVRQVREKTLYPALQARLEIVKASLYLADHQPQMAMQRLKFTLTPLPPELKAKALLVRGQVHVALGDLPAAVEDWTERETYLPIGSPDVTANRDLIWNTLSETHTPYDVNKLPAGTTPTARGWLELADIERTSWQQPEKFLDQIKQWQSKYPNHPAQQKLVPDLVAKQQALTSFPPKIAVLLPLSGNYQSSADAVRDGLLAAYYQVGGSNPPSITLYDSGISAASAQAAYQKAVGDGASIVVGPLTKDSVSGLASQPSLPVPVLALNYLDNNRGGPNGFYQFGLLPEGEAAQVAERAVAEGRMRAVALVANDELGARMFNAFSARFSALGGVILGMQTYPPNARPEDLTGVLGQLLNLDASDEREQRLASTIGTHLEFEPRRRQDVQFIFLAASARDARTVQPQIAYNHAEDVPVYSTSRVYELDANVDNTVLNGITFDDMPWTLEESGSVADMRAALAKDWPNNFAGNSRLYALGFDAYRLVPLLYNTHGIAQAVQGVTGLLSLDPDGRVHRRLDWANFDDGNVDLLAPVDLPAQAPVSAVQPVPKP
ncbi:MAG TPA: penicillin-binding protein activator [Gammaproteobacteria bacterium]